MNKTPNLPHHLQPPPNPQPTPPGLAPWLSNRRATRSSCGREVAAPLVVEPDGSVGRGKRLCGGGKRGVGPVLAFKRNSYIMRHYESWESMGHKPCQIFLVYLDQLETPPVAFASGPPPSADTWRLHGLPKGPLVLVAWLSGDYQATLRKQSIEFNGSNWMFVR